MAYIALIPYWYVRMWLESGSTRPSDYFLRGLENHQGGLSQALYFLPILSIARLSFDAHLALRALELVGDRAPVWALAERDIRLLLEASLWLGGEPKLEAVGNALMRKLRYPQMLSSILVSYRKLATCGTEESELTSTQMELPALYWNTVALELESMGRIQESRNALHNALGFVPDSDPLRSEMVAKFLRLDAIHRSSE